MSSILDYFLPQGNNLSPDQLNYANSQGLINAAANLANMNAPHAGPAATPLQMITGGMQGYGQGANNYLNQFYQNESNQSDATMKALAAQRATNYFAPQKAGNGMAAALAGPAPGGVPAQPPSLSSFYSSPAPGGAPGTPGMTPPTAPNMPFNRPNAPGAASAGMGDSKNVAAVLYKQGMDQMMLGQPGGDKLIEQAISLDPTLAYQKAYTTSRGTAEGALPSDLTKIRTEASLRPHDQQVMINGQLYTVPSNDAAASRGAVPSGVSAPVATGVSTTVPASAKSQADAAGKNTAEADQAKAQFDSRVGNAIQIIDKMTKLAPNTYVGAHGKLGNAIADEGIPGVSPLARLTASNSDQADFENLNSNLFTQELPAIIKGAGGRLDIPLLNAIKEASAVDPYAPTAVKTKVLSELKANLMRGQQNAANMSSTMRGNPTQSNTAPSSYNGWSATRMP